MSRVRQWFGSITFTVFLFLSVVVYSFVVVLTALGGGRAVYAAVKLWVRMVLAALKLLCRLDYTVEGKENIPTENGIAYLKHSSALETIVGIMIFPRQTWVLKRELMWAPFLGWALALLKPIAINRSAGGTAVEQVVEQGMRRLESGLWVTVFPEGTRMPVGETRRYGISGALLASRSGCPLVPVAHNAGVFWPRRGWLKRPGTVRFVVGKPIATANRDPRDINNEAQDWIERTIKTLEG